MVELAVAVIIAGAFGKVVDAVVKFLMDIIAPRRWRSQLRQPLAGHRGQPAPTTAVITAVVGFVIPRGGHLLHDRQALRTARERLSKGEKDEVAEVDPQLELLKEIRDTLRARG